MLKELDIFRNMTALVVEDDKSVAQNLKLVLDELFQEVEVSHDGEDALNLFFSKKPDILFVDIMMPKMNGIELISKIRETDKLVKIVIVSAHNTQAFLMEAVKLKLEAFVVKPINFDFFLKVLQNIAQDCTGRYSSLIELKSGAIVQIYNKTVIFENNTYVLTKSEYKLLLLLLSNQNQILSKETIENYLWLDGATSDSMLKSLINKLRKKIGKTSIESTSGFGYKLVI